MKVYGLKNCDTCRKAMKDFTAAGHDLELIEIRGKDVTKKRIESWIKAVGAEALVNRRSTTWRSLSDAEKEQATGAKAASLLADNPTLIKRPVIEIGDTVYVGWTPANKTALL